MTNQQPDSETTIYCVKYALSQGIFRARKLLFGYFEEKRGDTTVSYYLRPRHWRLTWPEALQAAEKMRERKIASLQKQIARLQSIQFTEPTE